MSYLPMYHSIGKNNYVKEGKNMHDEFNSVADIDDALDFASVDVSFISLTKVLGPARELLKDHGQMVCLIKPQFEAGREKVGKKGVVRDKNVHSEVIEKVYADIFKTEDVIDTYNGILPSWRKG